MGFVFYPYKSPKHTEKYHMKCPACQVSFHPQMHNTLVGTNANNANVYVYFQICPDCKEPVIGIKEAKKDEFFLLASDAQDLILLTRQK
jgi:phage terminase large subunit GpA-like protein